MVRTHIDSPSYPFEPTVEPIREISVLSVLRMHPSPDINEFIGVRMIWQLKDILESSSFGFGISCSFIPILFRIRKVCERVRKCQGSSR